jgi:hypothetical protein
MLLPSLWFSFRDTPVSIKLFFQTISIPACFGLVMAVVLMILSYGIAFWPSTLRIGVSLLAAVISYLGLWMVYPTGRKLVVEDVSYVLSVLQAGLQRR